MSDNTMPSRRPVGLVCASRERRAFTIPEVMLAGALLAVILSSAIPLLMMAARHRIVVTQRVVAAELVATRLSDFAAVPYGELTSERLTAIIAADTTSHLLSDVQHNWSVSSTQVALGCKEIAVELKWSPQPGQTQQVQLRHWRFPEPSTITATVRQNETPELQTKQAGDPETSEGA